MTESDRQLFFEDLAPGQVYRSGSVKVTAEEIKKFAAQFDPQPFHLDEELARDSLFKGLAASGWHTAAMTMRLLVDGEMRLAKGTIGGSVEELRWVKPVRPGDTLRIETEILSKRETRTRPDFGVVQTRTTTFNQNDEPVQTKVVNAIVPRRHPGTAAS